MSRLPPARFGLGFHLPGPLLALDLPNRNTLYSGGGGSSWIFIDMDARTTFAYAANKMDRRPLSDPRPFRVIKAMWQALGLASAGVRNKRSGN